MTTEQAAQIIAELPGETTLTEALAAIAQPRTEAHSPIYGDPYHDDPDNCCDTCGRTENGYGEDGRYCHTWHG